VDVGVTFSVGDGVTDICSRANQEEPRTSIAPLGAEEHPDVDRGILDKDDGT
jgi:hypothetical protein